MKVEFNENRSVSFWGLLLLLAIGVGLGIFGFKVNTDNKRFSENSRQARGYLVDIYESEDSDDDDIYYGIYEYEVDEIIYTVRSDSYEYNPSNIEERSTVYYDLTDPSNAKTTLNDGIGNVLIVVGIIFTLLALAFLLAFFNVNGTIVEMLLGIMLMVLGFVLPIMIKNIILTIILGLFGILGTIITIKAFLKLIGKEGGTLDKAIDQKTEQAAEVLFGAATDVNEHSELISKVTNGINIIRAIPLIIMGLIFILTGLVSLFSGSTFVAIPTIVLGIIIIVAAIKYMRR